MKSGEDCVLIDLPGQIAAEGVTTGPWTAPASQKTRILLSESWLLHYCDFSLVSP